MAKIPVKKTASQKGKKTAAKKSVTSKVSPAKKRSAKKTPGKKVISEKEREVRAANLIANSEKKKKISGKRPKKAATSKETSGLLDAIVEGIKDRKGKNIMILDLAGIDNRVTDVFVICDADSKTHVNSIADSVEDMVMKMTGERAYHTEGHQNGEWILIDYINIVTHVFLRETREHYNIEGLWGDAEITLIND
jgi:ribosome-associated protein